MTLRGKRREPAGVIGVEIRCAPVSTDPSMLSVYLCMTTTQGPEYGQAIRVCGEATTRLSRSVDPARISIQEAEHSFFGLLERSILVSPP